MSAELKHAARKALFGQMRRIAMGRSYHIASVNWQTRVEIVAGDLAPTLEGLPYLKTQFQGKGGFSRTLYTPSTMRIVVGESWKEAQ